MSLELGFLAGGSLLLCAGLAGDLVRRTPLTFPVLYLLAGLLLGPSVLGWFHFNPLQHAGALELITEIAVLISLFTAGMKMPMPLTWPRWKAPLRLAFVGVAVSVALMAGFLSLVLGMTLGSAVLLAAILAPTDPVLATEVQVRRPGDRERLRFGLTSEGGLNDGSAFPFVMLGLGLLGVHEFHGPVSWLLRDVVMATGIALIVGWCGGGMLALTAYLLRTAGRPWDLMDDFLGLGLIGVVYGLCLMADAWGFLGVFFGALSLRHHEFRLEQQSRVVLSHADRLALPSRVSEASLAFKEQLERLCEVVLVLLIGCTLFAEAGYVDFGEVTDQGGQFEADGIPLAVIAELPLSPAFAPYAKLGQLYWDAEGPGTSEIGQQHYDGNDTFYGVGARLRLSSMLDLKLDYERFRLDSADVDMASAGLAVRF